VSSYPALLLASVALDALWSVLSFVVWIAVMVWIYNLAKRKGRHPVGWVILAFFFFILALLLLLILPSKRTTRDMERA
jgi:cbb3-type cytochrome oxidase subunit 3